MWFKYQTVADSQSENIGSRLGQWSDDNLAIKTDLCILEEKVYTPTIRILSWTLPNPGKSSNISKIVQIKIKSKFFGPICILICNLQCMVDLAQTYAQTSSWYLIVHTVISIDILLF